jgi:hypothetical protein
MGRMTAYWETGRVRREGGEDKQPFSLEFWEFPFFVTRRAV